MKRELQGSADLQPLILDLNFWHRSFLTTIIVDHYPLFEFSLDYACSKIKMFIMIIINSVCIKASIMLCSFGTSIEASAPAVLSLWHCMHTPNPLPLRDHTHSTSVSTNNHTLQHTPQDETLYNTITDTVTNLEQNDTVQCVQNESYSLVGQRNMNTQNL